MAEFRIVFRHTHLSTRPTQEVSDKIQTHRTGYSSAGPWSGEKLEAFTQEPSSDLLRNVSKGKTNTLTTVKRVATQSVNPIHAFGSESQHQEGVYTSAEPHRHTLFDRIHTMVGKPLTQICGSPRSTQETLCTVEHRLRQCYNLIAFSISGSLFTFLFTMVRKRRNQNY